MKLSTENWPIIDEKSKIDEKYKSVWDEEEREKFIGNLRDDITKFKEHMNSAMKRLNNWASRVKLSVNKINPRYQFQGTVVTLTITAGEVGNEETVAHGLKYTPSYWNVLDSTIAGYICRSKAFDSTNCYFKAGATGTATIAVW